MRMESGSAPVLVAFQDKPTTYLVWWMMPLMVHDVPRIGRFRLTQNT
jgi:hypothetical protein